MNTLNPKKLLLSKWTAVAPVNREKHFLVTRIVPPAASDPATDPANSPAIEWVEIQAVHSGATRRIAWRELREQERWRQGWV